MSPGTHSRSHAARNPSTVARGPAGEDGGPAAAVAGTRGVADGAVAADAGEAEGDTDSSVSSRAAMGDTGGTGGDRTARALTAPIGALERIVIGSVGITTQALAQAAPEVELTFSQWRALLILGDPPSGRRVSEVAARVGVTVPATSRLLRRLERRGLVALAPDEADRRATRATLTSQGARVRDAILAFRRAALRDVAEHATAAGQEIAGPEIDSLAASFERYA